MGVRESGEEGVCAPRGELSKDLFCFCFSIYFNFFFRTTGRGVVGVRESGEEGVCAARGELSKDMGLGFFVFVYINRSIDR